MPCKGGIRLSLKIIELDDKLQFIDVFCARSIAIVQTNMYVSGMTVIYNV